MIKVLFQAPGHSFVELMVKNELKSFQGLVGGYIETVTLAEDVVIVCNEEGHLLDLPFNCEICGAGFVGNIVVAGVSGDEFSDVPDAAKRLLAPYI